MLWAALHEALIGGAKPAEVPGHILGFSVCDRLHLILGFDYFRVCAGFEEMQTKCRTIPQSSEELIELNAFMEEARCQGMVRMEEKIQVTSCLFKLIFAVFLST